MNFTEKQYFIVVEILSLYVGFRAKSYRAIHAAFETELHPFLY